MSNSQYIGTSFIDGLLAPNYFNGRILAAEDLQADHNSALSRESWLGKAIGYGVVSGLWVSQVGATSVKITAGVGLNQQGQVIDLPDETTLPLVLQTRTTGPIDDAGHFSDCNFGPSSSAGPLTAGAYLLTAVPASRLEGMVPMQAAGSASQGGCASKWERTGIQFKAIRLTAFPDAASLGQSGGKITAQNQRNLLAHWCFGSLTLRQRMRNPATFDETFTGLDALPAADLTPCDVPLAVLYWNGSSIDFVDVWSARRRLVHPHALQGWTGMLGDKRMAEGQARFLQFQDQVTSLSNQAGNVTAAQYFPLLPACGLLPIQPPNWILDYLHNKFADPLMSLFYRSLGRTFTGVPEDILQRLSQAIQAQMLQLDQQVLAILPKTGFDPEQFFSPPANVVAHMLTDWSTVGSKLRRSWWDEAICIGLRTPINLYYVDENLMLPLLMALSMLVKTTSDSLNIAPLTTSQVIQAWQNTVLAFLETGSPIVTALGSTSLREIGYNLDADLAGNPSQLYVAFVREPAQTQTMSIV